MVSTQKVNTIVLSVGQFSDLVGCLGRGFSSFLLINPIKFLLSFDDELVGQHPSVGQKSFVSSSLTDVGRACSSTFSSQLVTSLMMTVIGDVIWESFSMMLCVDRDSNTPSGSFVYYEDGESFPDKAS